ncbi:MAG TPA: YgjV family protein [Azospirillaceae bacterium]|nr:YgjV family protein [Azospirillaceae bacterium]
MIEAFLEAPAANILGLLGAVLGATWPLYRSRNGMLLAQVAVAAAFTGHYVLIGGAMTAALMNILAGLQALAAIPLGTRPGFRRVYLLTLPLIAAGTVYTWNGWPSVFAAVAMTLLSIGRYQTDTMRFRVLVGLTLPFWFGNNVLVGSVPGMLSDMFGTLFNAMNLLRDHRARRAATVPAA